MDISFKTDKRILVIGIVGEIDHHTAYDIKTKIDKEFSRSNAKHIIFDFKDVTFMDSSGIGMVIGRYKLLEKAGGKIALIHINNDLNRIFEISGLYKLAKSFINLDEAMNSLA